MSTALTTSSSNKLALIVAEIDRDPHLKSENTRRGYKSDLAAFEEWRQGRPLTKLLVEEYAAHLQTQKRTPNTINRVLVSVRWWARRLGDLAYEDPTVMPYVRSEIVVQAARVVACAM
jgi:site-specific recombinase XerD